MLCKKDIDKLCQMTYNIMKKKIFFAVVANGNMHTWYIQMENAIHEFIDLILE